MTQEHSIYDANYDPCYDDFNENSLDAFSDSDKIREMEPLNMKIRFGNTDTKA